MKKFLSIVLLVLLTALPAYALEETKQLKLQDAATATGDGTTIVVAPYTSIALQVTISDTATVTFEATQDGTNWASTVCTSSASTTAALVTSATATGLYQCPVAGFSEFRARISAYTDGLVSVNARVTTAVLGKKGGGGGGGASITVKEADDDPSVSDVTTLQVTSGHLTDNGGGNVSIDLGGTLDDAFDNGKTITGADSLANAVQIGDGVTPICLYTDATIGPQVRPCTDANVRQVIPNGFTGGVYDEEGAAMVETIDPDAASAKAIYTYGTAYKPLKSVWFGAGSLSTDGTQCAAPAEVTINSGPKIWSIICTDNDASTILGSIKMPDSWDGGTVTFEHVYIQTAADTSALNGDIAAQCHGNGETVDSTWGTEIAIDDAAVTGSNKNDFTTSAAVTPAGTCAAGDMLYFRYQLDATGTTTAVATLHHVGFKMEYSITSRSD